MSLKAEFRTTLSPLLSNHESFLETMADEYRQYRTYLSEKLAYTLGKNMMKLLQFSIINGTYLVTSPIEYGSLVMKWFYCHNIINNCRYALMHLGE